MNEQDEHEHGPEAAPTPVRIGETVHILKHGKRIVWAGYLDNPKVHLIFDGQPKAWSHRECGEF